MSAENRANESVAGMRSARLAVALVISALVLLVAGCGGGSSGNSGGSGKSGGGAAGETTAREGTAQNAASSEAAKLARAKVGPKEITNMIPADGKKPDPARPLPKVPPKGIKVYPATTNKSVRGPIHYDRHPPTNGDHDPLWQNCGFYQKPIKDRNAVHSLDHGVVWITYRPNLPKAEVDKLRPYGDENYVVVSPYPGQKAPVIATSWRVQLKLKGPEDPRLRRFVNDFRVSEIAPLSGNRCVLGVGNPKG